MPRQTDGSESRTKCSIAGCPFDAEWWLEVTWTLADFGDWYACHDHVRRLWRDLFRKTIEGYSPEIVLHAVERAPFDVGSESVR